MGRTRSTPLVFVMLLAVLPNWADAQSPSVGTLTQPNTVRIGAATASVAARQGAFKAGDVTWSCKGTRCSATALSSAVMNACQGLARELGALQSVTVASRSLPPADLRQCNSVVGTAGAVSASAERLLTPQDVAPLARPLPASPGRVVVTPRAPSKDAPTPAAAPGVFAPKAVRTTQLTLTGTGATEIVVAFKPVATKTKPLTLTGTGATEITFPFTPVAARTTPLTLTGTGRIE